MEIQKSEHGTFLRNRADHILANPPAFSLEKKTVFQIVQISVAKCYADLNWKAPSDADKSYLINELTDNIRSRYKSLRAEEIPIAFSRGIRGEYGEFMGLSVITFEKFISEYLNSQFRIDLGKSMPKAIEQRTEVNLTREDRIAFANQAFAKFKVDDFYNDLGNIVYDFLDSEGLITFTAKEKFEIMEQVRKREYDKLQNPTSSREKKQFDDAITKLIEGNDSIIPHAKRECLRLYFLDLKSKNLEIPFKP